MGAWWILVAAAWALPVGELEAAREVGEAWRGQRMGQDTLTLSTDQWAEVAAGEVVTGLIEVEGEKAKKSYGVALLDQPIGRVWGAISDETMHPRYTSLEYAELVKGEPCASGRRVLQYLPVGVPLVQDRWWVTIRTNNDPLAAASGGAMRELVWRNAPDGSDVTSEAGRARLEAGVMVGFTRGSWLLTAVGEGQTLVEYVSWVDPGGRLSPSLMTMFAGRTLRKTLDAMEAIARDPDTACVPNSP